jgi:ankyrin repeat protein
LLAREPNLVNEVVDAQELSVLMNAIKRRHGSTHDLLVAKNADVNEYHSTYKSPLAYAAEIERWDIVLTLLGAGAVRGIADAYLDCQKARNKPLSTRQEIADKYVSLAAGDWPIHQIVVSKIVTHAGEQVIETFPLLRALSAPSVGGQVSLDVEYLVTHLKANPNVELILPDGQIETPLTVAARKGSIELIRFLRRNDAMQGIEAARGLVEAMPDSDQKTELLAALWV